MSCNGYCEHLPVASFSSPRSLTQSGLNMCCNTVHVEAAEFSGSCKLSICSEQTVAPSSSLPGLAERSRFLPGMCSYCCRQGQEMNHAGPQTGKLPQLQLQSVHYKIIAEMSVLHNARIQTVETRAFSAGVITWHLPKRKLKQETELFPGYALRKAELHTEAEQQGYLQTFFN